MGAVLDSSENIRQNSTNTSRKAYKIKEKLEKNKDESVKMEKIQCREFMYIGLLDGCHGIRFRILVLTEGSDVKNVFVTPTLDRLCDVIPIEIRPEISNFVREHFNYKREPNYINPLLN